ncbi:hypothetical protein GCM10009847_04440 [Leucobacter tardus]|uniref:Uncharacterized protein n=1 Tax=Leucobacter tardus TaxID=501483 RepID=A0A939QBD9_9MICO|nr:hypothetical protein [Leucobacter tardus]MBO2988651.1 hypothetical protein [Leucobacter tardus]
MPFAFIRSTSRPYLAAAESAEAAPANSAHAIDVLRADFERWSRWALGLLGFTLAISGSFVAIGVAETARLMGGPLMGIDLVATMIAAGVALTGIAVLAMLWWSGRRLASAATWWMRFSYAQGQLPRRALGWLHARTVNFEPRILLRLVTGTLALLLAIGGIALAIRDFGTAATPYSSAAAIVGVISAVSGVGQLGGVLRIVSGAAEQDPLWARIRKRAASGQRRSR